MKENGRAFTIGVLMGNVHSPYTVQLLQGMAEAAREEKTNMIYFLGTHSSYLLESMLGQSKETNYDYQFNTIYDYANLEGMDALIVSYGSLCIFLEEDNKELFLSRFKNIPYLLLEDESEEGEDSDFMIIDNYTGMYQLAEHLVRDHGYTRIVYVSGPKGNKDALERMTALLDACAQYGVTVPEDAIEYGNFSEYADEQIKNLLNRYPDTQAIVCANDEMAYAGYRVCKERGLRVGKDIAITGFDNNVTAEVVNPPITTVEQNSFNMGYIAVLNTLKLCEGKRVGGIRVPTEFKKRESCGCNADAHVCPVKCEQPNDEKEIRQLAQRMADEIIKTKANRSIYQKCLAFTEDIIRQVLRLAENREKKISEEVVINIISIIEQMTHGRIGKYIPLISLNNEVARLFFHIGDYVEDPEGKLEIMSILTTVQKKMEAYDALKKENEITVFHIKSWFVQMIAREMTESLDEEEEFFLSAIGKLKLLGVKSSYIYLLDKVHIHHAGEEWNCPDQLYMAAYHAGEETVSYKQKQRPVVSREYGFPNYFKDQNGHQLSAFILFSDERQYGLLLCEMDPEYSAIIYFTSLQIGTALRFLELRKAELEMRNQLQESIQTIKAKNEVLNFISEYDELTGLLNRRGFMERAMMVNQSPKNAGRKAVFIFGDLDHLKEINDCFGHGEGDYAIRKAGERLKESLYRESILGRIGGDEFVAMSMADHYLSMEDLKNKIKEYFTKGNEESDKPYYVEMSIGYIEFICGEDQDLSSIIKKADECLYHDKKSRRITISRK